MDPVPADDFVTPANGGGVARPYDLPADPYPALDVRTPLLDLLGDLASNQDIPRGGIDWDALPRTQRHQAGTEEQALSRISESLRTYILDSERVGDDSDIEGPGADVEEEVEEAHQSLSNSDSNEGPSSEDSARLSHSATCVIDILRHVPRCAFSEKQNSVIHWALLALGMTDIPTEHTMNRVSKALQRIYGVSSIRYKGVMGHIYYVNDFAALIAQEVANSRVRPHLRFLPEDAGTRLAETWQGSRWLRELQPDLTTPMVRVHGQDFYIHEPAQLADGRVCIPTRWFTRGSDTLAQAWTMLPTTDGSGWIIAEDLPLEISVRQLLVAFPNLQGTHCHYNLPDPRNIIGVRKMASGGIFPWTMTSLDEDGQNRWRKLAKGHRVHAFPVWLFCDDTSGNVSKKWNKHNSFLFTAAGLPRRLVHQEYNIHFLATSNTAPPLEMLDGIADQLVRCQESGVWAYDCELKEMVLLIPSILAVLGDNPMQSEIACHIGLAGKLFCRICRTFKGNPDDEDEEDGDEVDGRDFSDTGSQSGSDISALGPGSPRNGRRRSHRKRTSLETMAEMVERIKRFMTVGDLRCREETISALRSQFCEAQRVGGQAEYKRRRTRLGVKDTYQEYFAEHLFRITTSRGGRSRTDKEEEVQALLKTMPRVDEGATSPVWRIKDLDPHKDTPVEILHVILLGFVKYFWRDAVGRLKDPAKKILIARLSSFDVSGLKIAPLSGSTLVNYAGSLVGRDFRALAQVAPFVLHDLPGIPEEHIKAWVALSHIIPMVWQPEIRDLPQYLVRLQDAINNFLDATCTLTPRWFNKPKFHLLLHLPEHIRRFGPAMLFATEGFESFNAVIRSHSIHSNHRAPSRDIALAMAHHNRIRHILSGGYVRKTLIVSEQEDDVTSQVPPERSPWLHVMNSATDLEALEWRTAGPSIFELLTTNQFATNILGLFGPDESIHQGDVERRLVQVRRTVDSLALQK
ncbi:hypothetical protein OH76DRAFT_1459488 [Lentinus brumalis]|uniref:Uncharacterized protein n=1 Tax=Lentinus brumalis TaxID=2498619 RepID=A0A371CJQ2_9APHY|nr:hypothetical protein OH76DRAFT_1459488 [Polyporus brumalis]